MREQRSILDIFLCLPLLFLRQGLSLKLKLPDWACLAGSYQATDKPHISFCLNLPMLELQTSTTGLFIYMGIRGFELTVSHFHEKPCPQLQLLSFLNHIYEIGLILFVHLPGKPC